MDRCSRSDGYCCGRRHRSGSGASSPTSSRQHRLKPGPSPDFQPGPSFEAPNSSIYWSPAGGNPVHYAQTTGFYGGSLKTRSAGPPLGVCERISPSGVARQDQAIPRCRLASPKATNNFLPRAWICSSFVPRSLEAVSPVVPFRRSHFVLRYAPSDRSRSLPHAQGRRGEKASRQSLQPLHFRTDSAARDNRKAEGQAAREWRRKGLKRLVPRPEMAILHFTK
jgi:hypothetical protein